jgi:hypothetical protein
MTGTLTVTAGRGEAGLDQAAPRRLLVRPVGPAAIRVFYSVGYTRERNMPTVGTNGYLAINPVRSNAVESRFHCVQQRAGGGDLRGGGG